MNLKLGIAMTLNPRTRPILDGTVKADGIELIPRAIHPTEMFWRQLKFADFGVSCGGVVACVTC
jgi:4,5-dihydroxyphthalate decarboxylase